jgi:hypothetical protein
MPKYKVGQKFVTERQAMCEIIAVSPTPDYNGNINYFVKWTETNGDIHYLSHDEEFMDFVNEHKIN